ncbi:hypothetical protein IC617_08180 [Neiella sp. HB171785]|uniref:Uncharacterized protein n=1 Tax=Neiella litorisoli TaxID=2771431 RepID=A0A8J6UG00_9GAMM|nr:hypothetical protein [Neiella litorisoli]MBD1389401.1 hypothetical protein [Neiella litorisoli]
MNSIVNACAMSVGVGLLCAPAAVASVELSQIIPLEHEISTDSSAYVVSHKTEVTVTLDGITEGTLTLNYTVNDQPVAFEVDLDSEQKYVSLLTNLFLARRDQLVSGGVTLAEAESVVAGELEAAFSIELPAESLLHINVNELYLDEAPAVGTDILLSAAMTDLNGWEPAAVADIVDDFAIDGVMNGSGSVLVERMQDTSTLDTAQHYHAVGDAAGIFAGGWMTTDLDTESASEWLHDDVVVVDASEVMSVDEENLQVEMVTSPPVGSLIVSEDIIGRVASHDALDNGNTQVQLEPVNSADVFRKNPLDSLSIADVIAHAVYRSENEEEAEQTTGGILPRKALKALRKSVLDCSWGVAEDMQPSAPVPTEIVSDKTGKAFSAWQFTLDIKANTSLAFAVGGDARHQIAEVALTVDDQLKLTPKCQLQVVVGFVPFRLAVDAPIAVETNLTDWLDSSSLAGQFEVIRGGFSVASSKTQVPADSYEGEELFGTVGVEFDLAIGRDLKLLVLDLLKLELNGYLGASSRPDGYNLTGFVNAFGEVRIGALGLIDGYMAQFSNSSAAPIRVNDVSANEDVLLLDMPRVRDTAPGESVGGKSDWPVSLHDARLMVSTSGTISENTPVYTTLSIDTFQSDDLHELAVINPLTNQPVNLNNVAFNPEGVWYGCAVLDAMSNGDEALFGDRVNEPWAATSCNQPFQFFTDPMPEEDRAWLSVLDTNDDPTRYYSPKVGWGQEGYWMADGSEFVGRKSTYPYATGLWRNDCWEESCTNVGMGYEGNHHYSSYLIDRNNVVWEQYITGNQYELRGEGPWFARYPAPCEYDHLPEDHDVCVNPPNYRVLARSGVSSRAVARPITFRGNSVIAHITDGGANGGIYRFHANGQMEWFIKDGARLADMSDNGKSAIYWQDYQLYLVGNDEPLTPAMPGSVAKLSGDGEWIYVSTNKTLSSVWVGNHYQLFRRPVDGGEWERVIDHDVYPVSVVHDSFLIDVSRSGRYAFFTSKGKWVAGEDYNRDTDAYVIDTQNMEVTWLAGRGHEVDGVSVNQMLPGTGEISANGKLALYGCVYNDLGRCMTRWALIKPTFD